MLTNTKLQAAKILVVKILMVSIFTLVGLLIGEGLVRLLPQELVEYKYTKVLEGDPLLGIPPSQTDPTEDFPEKAKPKGVYRIVVLGDSHTVMSRRNQSTYPEVLEILLNGVDLKGKRVEVHNAGAPGHSHYQYYLSLDRRLKKYDPDLVIVGFYIGNDFLDLYRNDDRPNLSFDGGEFVHKDPIFFKFNDPDRTNHGVLGSSRLLQFVRVTLHRIIGYQMDRVRILWGIGKKTGEGNIAAARFLYPVIRGYFIHQHIFRQSMLQILFLERFQKEQKVIDKVNLRVTQLMKATAEKSGMELLYIPIPTKLQIEPDSEPMVLQKTLEVSNLGRNALMVEDRLYESFTSLLEAQGINHVDVRDRLKMRANESKLYDVTYHITVKSHEIIAKSLYEVVAPMLMSADAL